MASIPASPPPMIPPRPANDARAAFFRGGGLPAVAPQTQVQAQTAPVAAPQARAAAPQAPTPDRPLRPGSIIDIRV